MPVRAGSSPRSSDFGRSRLDNGSTVEEKEQLLAGGLEGAMSLQGRPARSRLIVWLAVGLALMMGYFSWRSHGSVRLAPIVDDLAWTFDRSHDYLRANASAPCDWTYTVDFGAMSWGMGSVLYLQMLGIDWALLQGRTILFDRSQGTYGRYTDFFQPRDPLRCQPAEDLYNTRSERVCGGNSCVNPLGKAYGPRRKNHTAIVGDEIEFVQEWGLSRFMNDDEVLAPSFPRMDSQKPLPIHNTLPDAFTQGYSRIHSIWQTYYTPSDAVQAMIDERVAELKPVKARAPLIALHWRKGDKLRECQPSAQMSCFNVTLHAETAWNAYLDLKSPLNGRTPTLLIVSAEPDAVDLFQADPIGSRFEVMRMPAATVPQGFAQSSFNGLPIETKRNDMRTFLADFWYAVEHADSFVVSGLSNAGRLALTMAGEEKIRKGILRSVDLWWHPGSCMVAPPKCMGRSLCYP